MGPGISRPENSTYTNIEIYIEIRVLKMKMYDYKNITFTSVKLK